MSADNRKAAEQWLKLQGLIDPSMIPEEAYNQMRSLVGHDGFGAFYAVLLHQRQQALALLSNAKLGSAERDCAASVLQGQVAAIDLVRDFILLLADPTPDADEGQNRSES